MTSPWSVPIFTNLTIPTGAGPGEARIVLSSELPPPLDTYVPSTWFPTSTGFAAAIIFYSEGDDTTYTFLAVVEDGPPVEIAGLVGGFVTNGVLQELNVNAPMGVIWNGNNGGGQPDVLIAGDRVREFARTLLALQSAADTTISGDTGNTFLNLTALLAELRTAIPGIPITIAAAGALTATGTSVTIQATVGAGDVTITSVDDVVVDAAGDAIVDGALSVDLRVNGTGNSRVLLDSTGVSIAAPGGGDDITLTAADDVFLTAGSDVVINAGGALMIQTNQGWVTTFEDTAVCSAALVLAVALANVTGCALNFTTVTTNAKWRAQIVCDVNQSTAGATTARGVLLVDGAAQTSEAIFETGGTTDRATVTQVYSGVFAAAGNHTFQLQGAVSAVSGTTRMEASHTTLQVGIKESGG